MSSMRILCLGVAVMSMSLSLAAEDYAIHLTDKDKVGDKSELTQNAVVSNKTVISMGGKVVQNKDFKFTVNFSGVSTVLKVDDKKRASEVSVEINSLTKQMNGGKPIEVLPKGTTVIVKKQNGKTVFLIDGKPVDKSVAGVMGVLFSLPQSQITDDDVFGTKERKKEGDSWPINTKLAMEDLAKKGLKIEGLSGVSKLEKVSVVNGVKILKVSAEMKTDKFQAPLPPSLTVTKSTMLLSAVGDTAADEKADTTGIPLKSDMSMSMSFSAEGKPNPQAPTMKLSVDTSRKQTITKKKIK